MTPATPTRTLSNPASSAPQFPAGIELVGSQMRSTNLERDVEDALHDPYVGARAVDVLERIASALADQRRTRAWSFTGPYGSGKSTLSNIIDALLGRDAKRRSEAERILEEASPALAQRLAAARDAIAPEGFLGGVATARRESVVATLSRALHTAAARRWGKRVPKAIATALEACTDPDRAGTNEILGAVTALTADGQQPLLLVIDEFGKTLEHLAGHNEFADAQHDLFLLQELAEKAAGPNGLPVYLMTLQHLSFMDYASRSSELKTREWAKIQGRFEDITFVPHHGDSLHMLRRRLDHSAVNSAGQALINASAEASADIWTQHGLGVLAELGPDHFADLYPLHPITALAAPALAAQIGQHDRSLSGFLNSGEPNTVRHSLAQHSNEKAEHASTVRLPQLYDYFLNSGRTTLLASANAGRWIEVDSRIRDANGLPDADQDVLKTIGVLNLIDSDGALSATAPMIHFALHDPTDVADSDAFTALEERLADLVRRGFVVHREFSGEYRVWQGTDVDIDGRLKDIISHFDDAAVIDRLSSLIPQAFVASRHSQITGMMRVFYTAVSGPETKTVAAPDELREPADGLVVFHLGTDADRPAVHSPLPVLVGTTANPDVVLTTATYLVALKELSNQQDIDHVARREVIERLVQAEAELLELLQDAFYPPSSQASWSLWHTGVAHGEEPAASGLTARSLSGLVSLACESVYPHTPHIRNEMLGRHVLTSQAAQARGILLTAMLSASGEENLGLPGYKAERAIYHGVLAYLGLHRENGETQAESQQESLLPYGFSPPGEGHEHAQPAWNALNEVLSGATERVSMEEVIRVLMSPPYGLKAGVVPVFLIPALIIRRHDVALFEEGTYLPRLTIDAVERLVKGPGRFSVKYTPAGDGQRGSIIKKLMVSLGVEAPRSKALRNPDLLAVASALITRVADLNKYARTTKNISADARAVRAAIAKAVDPDELVFHALPKALGLPEVPARTRASAEAANTYVERLTAAADELVAIESKLRAEVVRVLAKEFRLPAELPKLRTQLAARLRGFADAVLTRELRGFVDFVLSDSLEDEDWLEPIVVRLTNSALGDWDDHEAKVFPQKARAMAAALDRVGHLHHAGREVRSREEKLDAQLLTLTDSAGVEQRTLIYVPEQARGEADTLAADVLKRAEKALGPDGARILLAALAQRVTEAATAASERKAQG
ncbi:ATP-binding protein [Streptomyces alkaliphilus]|uniref:ATP-binding protein n=1 Tax=Streptomyces alkaliphilus TaxID=1472722 RepID=A0A7W3T9J1_9ACTN|nr:ATP-binding protein [Streptomyces alkaliphilus]MBB0242708.1 ATP-binding protein [Streptomyces alkaliphilus]